jgi:hypothetical protein
MDLVFKEDELDGKQGAQIQQAAQLIKQRFDQKRNSFHQIRNQYPLAPDWNELNEMVMLFDQQQFNQWNQKWNNIHRAQDINQFKTFFNEGNQIFDVIIGRLKDLNLHHGANEEVDAIKKDVLQRIETDLLNLKTDVAVQIEEGLNKLVGFNAEMGLEKNFKTNIENELRKSNKHRIIFLVLFVISVLSIPTFLASTFIMEVFKSLPYSELILLRVGITISAAVLSYFFFSQYKLYQLISLRYSHLFGFLGGGATFINQLIDGQGASRDDINKRMAELFMELEMVNGQVKDNQHPIEMTIDKAIEVTEKLSKITDRFKS